MKRKTIAILLAITVAASMVTACGTNTNSDTNITAESTEEQADENTYTVQVLSVDDHKIEAQIGTLAGGEAPDMSGDEAPEKPEGEAPDMSGDEAQEKPEGEAPDMSGDEAPEKPEGEAPDMSGDEAPEKPEGEAPDMSGDEAQEKPEGEAPGNPPSGMGGMEFQAGEEVIDFTIDDNTEITLEYMQGSTEGTIEDIVEGAVLEVTLDQDGCAETVVVKNLNKGNGFGGSDEVTNGTSANTISEDTEESGTTYTSSGDDENALRIDGAEADLDNITVQKTGGESSNTENGDFYGQNAGVLVLNGATATIKNASVTTDAVNGNGVFSYGSGTTVNISDSEIITSKNNSGGIQTTGGGTMNADNLTVETSGNSSAAIRSDRGGGDVNVSGGTYTTNGTGSPAIYCTADIEVEDAALQANASEGVVVEGKNKVSLKNCDLTGSMTGTYQGDEDENIHGIMIYQSMSGDADVGEAYFSAEGGSITTTVGDLFYVTNTDCEIQLENVELNQANDTFLNVSGNSSSRGWGTEGANGGDVTLTTKDQIINGNIIIDDISTLDYTMESGTEFNGSINAENSGKEVSVTMESGAVWNLTADSYVTAFEGDQDAVNTNGYHLYVNGTQVK